MTLAYLILRSVTGITEGPKILSLNCHHVSENVIDGPTLKVLLQDIEEFREVLPKSSH